MAHHISSLTGYSYWLQDVVTMCYGLMFVPDLQKALSEIRRVLKVTNKSKSAYVHKPSHLISKQLLGEIQIVETFKLTQTAKTSMSLASCQSDPKRTPAVYGRCHE